VIGDVRRLIYGLRPPALDELVAQFERVSAGR
jgi:signal transduction histidine kinase